MTNPLATLDPRCEPHEFRAQPLRLRVSHEHGTLLAVPPLDDAVSVAQQNHDCLRQATVDIQGRSLAQIRAWARREVAASAREYTSTWTDLPNDGGDPPLIFVGGHQPSLFHPGVWAKNAALSRLARVAGSLSINLVVDNDTFSTTGIRVPAGDRERPTIEMIPFDKDQSPQPWEDAWILDCATFEAFGDRVSQAMKHWSIDPVVGELWPLAVDHAREGYSLADCLTAARNRLERRWGIENLEFPLSRLCNLEPFLWFASHIFAQLPRFQQIYNESLDEYRHANRIRSHTHPVPELREIDGWLEAPFWVWRDGEHIRSRVYARQEGKTVALWDGREVFARLPLSPEDEACCAVEVLRELPQQGIHFRTRALTTTLFARLCFGDLFIHGIGGAKYDEMTDRIITRFFGITPPAYGTVSATMLLPLKPQAVKPADLRNLDARLRDLRYNPDRHLRMSDHAVSALVVEKERLIAEADAQRSKKQSRRIRREGRQTRYARFCRLQQINERLAECVEQERIQLERARALLATTLHANTILNSREFSYCLFPRDEIQEFMLCIAGQSATGGQVK